MLLITTYLIFLSLAAGSPCYNRVFDFSSTLTFSYFMSLFTISVQISNFIKSGPIRMLPEEKFGGLFIVLLCNMTITFFKLWFVNQINMIINDSIYTKHAIIRFILGHDFDIQASTIRFIITLMICVLPCAIFVSIF